MRFLCIEDARWHFKSPQRKWIDFSKTWMPNRIVRNLKIVSEFMCIFWQISNELFLSMKFYIQIICNNGLCCFHSNVDSTLRLFNYLFFTGDMQNALTVHSALCGDEPSMSRKCAVNAFMHVTSAFLFEKIAQFEIAIEKFTKYPNK